jgi:hypothetical protein
MFEGRNNKRSELSVNYSHSDQDREQLIVMLSEEKQKLFLVFKMKQNIAVLKDLL